MNEQAFRQAYSLPRNGTDYYYRHALIPSFIYTDGVRECAAAGCYWLLDIIATEFKEALHVESGKHHGYLGAASIVVTATGTSCEIAMWASIDPRFQDGREVREGRTRIYSRHVEWSDMVEGVWSFIFAAQDIANESNILSIPVVMCLVSED